MQDEQEDLSEIPATGLMAALSIIGSIAVVLILSGIAYIGDYMGTDFVLGCLVGAIFIGVTVRLKIGYWP